MNVRIRKLAVVGTAALALFPLLATSIEAQSRTSGVRISRGHVYVGGRHVGATLASDGRTGLAAIVNAAVGARGPGFGRPADVRAGRIVPPDRFGDGRFSGGFGRRTGGDGRFGPGRLPRVGANGILLGGELPLFLPFFCSACHLGLHPFLFGFPLFPVFPVVQVETGEPGRAADPIPWPTPERAPGPHRPRGPRIGRLVLEAPEAQPRKRWEGPCVTVHVTMATGTAHRLWVPLRSLEVETPEAARELLEERVRAGQPLRLTGFSGGGLTVPAGLVEEIEVEACPSEAP